MFSARLECGSKPPVILLPRRPITLQLVLHAKQRVAIISPTGEEDLTGSTRPDRHGTRLPAGLTTLETRCSLLRKGLQRVA